MRSRKPAQTVRGCALPTLAPAQLGTHGWPRAGPLGLPAAGPTTSSPCWVLVALGRPQLTDAGRWLVLAGDIVDSSADSPPSLKARTHSVSTGRSGVHAGGVTPAPGAEGFISSPSTKHGDWSQQGLVGTGTWAEFHPQEGALHPWVPIPGDGGWTPSPLPSPWAGCRLIPSTKNHSWGCHFWTPTAPSCLPHRRTLPQPGRHDGAQR